MLREEFRMPAGGGWVLGLLGGCFIIFAGVMAGIGSGELNLNAGTLIAVLISLPAGLVMIGTAVQRARYRLIIAPEGVRFGAEAELTQWASVGSLRFSPIRNELRVFDRNEIFVGKVSGGIAHFDRAALHLVRAATVDAAETPQTFTGHHGFWGWLGFLLVLGYLVKGIRYERLPLVRGVAWIWIGLFLFILLWKLRDSWKSTGRVELTIDRMGLTFRGRAGDWSARWESTARLPYVRGTIHGRYRTDTHLSRLYPGYRTVDQPGNWFKSPVACCLLFHQYNGRRTIIDA
jgi:hypothetical protein